MRDDQDRQHILDSLLSSRPEEVLAMFQNDLRGYIYSMEANLEVLSEKELTKEKHDAILGDMKYRTKSVRKGLDLILDYLKMRRKMSKPADENPL